VAGLHVIDPATGESRGWLALQRRAQGVSLGFTLSCKGDDLKGFARRLSRSSKSLVPRRESKSWRLRSFQSQHISPRACPTARLTRR